MAIEKGVTMEYVFVPDYTVEADTEDEAFARAIDAIEYDIAHYRKHGATQIEWVCLAEIFSHAEHETGCASLTERRRA